jgi:hypothetical protein
MMAMCDMIKEIRLTTEHTGKNQTSRASASSGQNVERASNDSFSALEAHMRLVIYLDTEPLYAKDNVRQDLGCSCGARCSWGINRPLH